MGRVETDCGRAGLGSWACWVYLCRQPKTAGLGQMVQPTRPEARRADPTLNMGGKSLKIDCVTFTRFSARALAFVAALAARRLGCTAEPTQTRGAGLRAAQNPTQQARPISKPSALEVIVLLNSIPSCGQWHRLQDQAQNETRLWWIVGELRVS
jgi:hypothetical protein